MNIIQRFRCFFGKHDWLLVSGSQTQTGYAAVDGFIPVHELQEDEVCDCCRLRRTRYGIAPSTLHTLVSPQDFQYHDGWPIDRDGHRLPGYLSLHGTYGWVNKPKYHGKETGDIKLVRRVL
jgi:hypothetical protein